MKPIIQTKISTPDGSVSGNCFRACLASILEIDIDSIPAFEDMGTSWHEPFWKFLREQNLDFEGTGYFKNPNYDGMEKLKAYEGIDGFIIVNGKSPRAWVTRGHSVVYKNGEMIHDPHPSSDGLTELESFYMIRRMPEEK
jgi:hypothetical protein